MIIYRQRCVRVAEVWFDSGLAPDSDVDVVSIRRSLRPINGHHNIASQTLVSDLTMSVDLLLNVMSGTNRYEIRRAEKTDNLSYKVLISPSLEDYKSFVSFYNAFASNKGLSVISNHGHKINLSYIQNRNIILTCVLKAGNPLVWHSYFVYGNRCRPIYSASHYRYTNDTQMRSLIGRANRWLHWQDMLKFKEIELCNYDWGGWHTGNDSVLLKINKFKESFGGVQTTVYDARYGITLLGRLENAALQAFHKL